MVRVAAILTFGFMASTSWAECEMIEHPSGAKYVECEPERIKAAKEEAKRAAAQRKPAVPGYEQSAEEFKANMDAAIATTEAERAAAKAKAEAMRAEREKREEAARARMAASKPREKPSFEATYDRFKNRTELWAPPVAALKGVNLTNRVMVQVFTHFPGKDPVAVPSAVAFAFRSVSDDGWKYLKCNTIDALVDGRPFPLPATKHDGDSIGGSSVYESVSFNLPWIQFVSLANSKSIEFRLCSTEIRVTEKMLESWRAFISVGTPKAR